CRHLGKDCARSLDARQRSCYSPPKLQVPLFAVVAAPRESHGQGALVFGARAGEPHGRGLPDAGLRAGRPAGLPARGTGSERALDRNRQGGPPQYDANFTVPIDWWLFGKRLAATEAARLGIDVAGADYADLIRKKVAETVVAFYDLLEAQELLKLSGESVKDV